MWSRPVDRRADMRDAATWTAQSTMTERLAIPKGPGGAGLGDNAVSTISKFTEVEVNTGQVGW